MGQVTAAEREKYKERGLFGIKEKCDKCGEPIISTSYPQKNSKAVWCEGCATGQRLSEANLEEEKRMKKASAEKKEGKGKASTKIGGFLLAGTAIADLYTFLEDEKKHKVADAKKVVLKHKKELLDRLGNLRRVGRKKGAWDILVDDDAGTVQMKLGKPSAQAPAPKKAKAEAPKETPKKEAKKTESKKDSAPAVKEPANSKGQAAVASLVRRTLKAGGDWTRNKMVEHLHDEHKIDVKRTEAAIASEIKVGGITEEDGELQLA
jgi:hypothetical protein